MKKIKIAFLYFTLLLLRYKQRFFKWLRFHLFLKRKDLPLHDMNSSGLVSIKPNSITFPQKGFIFLFVVLIAVLIIRTYLLSKPSFSEAVVGIYHQGNLPPVVLSLMSEPLVKIDPEGRPQPNLVTGWQISSDTKTYTFNLKDNLYWHDGSRLKSLDIKFNLPEDVEIKYPNEQTIEIKLPDSFVPFPSLLNTPILKKDTLTGLGKYQVSSVELSGGSLKNALVKEQNIISKLVLKPFKEEDNLPMIKVRFYPDEETAKVAFHLGEVDSVFGITEEGEFVGFPTADIKRIPNLNRIVAVFYNTQDNLLGEKNLRKALGYSIPLWEGFEWAKTSLPNSNWAYNQDLKMMTGSNDSAKKFLERAKFKQESPLTLTVIPSLQVLGETIIKSWNELGINSILRVESGSPQNFQALLTYQYIPLDPDQYALWHSTQSKTNLSKYKSDRVDKDLEDGRKEKDSAVRLERYLDLQKELADDSPATFLYFPNYNIVYRKTTENLLNQVLQIQSPYIK